MNVPEAVGVPLMVIVFDAQAAVTPEGKPVGVPIPVAFVAVCVIEVNCVLTHNVGVLDAELTNPQVPVVIFTIPGSAK